MHRDDECRPPTAPPVAAPPVAAPILAAPILAGPILPGPILAGQADEGEDGKRARAQPVRVYQAGPHRLTRPHRLSRPRRLTHLGVEQSPQSPYRSHVAGTRPAAEFHR